MARKNAAHDIVVESLTEALLQLMDKKPLSEITISELCKRAGVGRVSFYRNYNSKQDILVNHLSKTTDDWWQGFSARSEDEFYRNFWTELLTIYAKHKHLIEMIYKNNASYILKDHIFDCCGPKPEHDDTAAYTRAALAGAIYGLVDEWVRRGMGSFPVKFSIRDIISIMPGR